MGRISASISRDGLPPGSPQVVEKRRASICGFESRETLTRLHAAATAESTPEFARATTVHLVDGDLDSALRHASQADLHRSRMARRPLSLASRGFRLTRRGPPPAKALGVGGDVGAGVGDNVDDFAASKESIAEVQEEVEEDETCVVAEPTGWLSSVHAASLAMVVCGCCCQAPYELLLSSDRGCGNLVSLAEGLTGIIGSGPAAWAEARWVLPFRSHCLLAGAGVAFSMLTNRALASPLPTAVLCTLKNGTLVANVIVGVVVLRKRYSAAQLAAVAVVTLGLVTTAGRMRDMPTTAEIDTSDAAVAISCLTCALFVRALSGAMQEAAFARSGRASSAEMLFCRSVFALPIFALRAGNILLHAKRWVGDSVGGLPWPTVWVLLAANLLFDYQSKVLMTKLIATAGALHATLTLTVQKFVAFVISVLLLDPAGRSSPRLWTGAACVLLGTIAYVRANPAAPPSVAQSKRD